MSNVIVHPTVINGECRTESTRRTWRNKFNDYRDHLRRKASMSADEYLVWRAKNPALADAAEFSVGFAAGYAAVAVAAAAVEAMIGE